MWVMGRLRQSALQSWLGFVVLVPLIVISVHEYGIVGAAVSRALVAIFSLPLMLYLTSRACPVSYLDLASVLWRPLLAGILMVLALSVPVSYPATLVLALAAKVGLGAFVYIGTLAVLWYVCGKPDGVEATVLKYVGARKRLVS
jgi:O-antigen/teichoic acid export membrane protein